MMDGSQAAYARYKNVSKQTVTDWKTRGLVVFSEAGGVDFLATDAALVAHGIRQPESSELDTLATKLLTADGRELWSKAEAERVLENYAALLRQLAYDRESAKVVEIDDVISAVRQEYGIVRDRIGKISANVVPHLVALQSPELIKAAIDTEVNAALAELVDIVP